MARDTMLSEQRQQQTDRCRAWAQWRRGAVMLQLIAVAALLLAAALALADQLPDWLERSRGGPGALIAACLFYAGLLAVPFMPAMELGLLIMLVFGKSGAAGAYLATLLGLNLAYAIGRSLAATTNGTDIRLSGPLRARLARLAARLPGNGLSVLTVALLLNLPANVMVGGGGGIALLCGASGAIRWPAFAATVAVATAAVPLLFVAGVVGAEWLLP